VLITADLLQARVQAAVLAGCLYGRAVLQKQLWQQLQQVYAAFVERQQCRLMPHAAAALQLLHLRL
jgi:hypothetical protein